MDFNTNTKYFEKSSNLFTIIGLAIIALGVIMLFAMSYFIWFGLGVAVVGVAVIAISMGSKLKDSDIDQQAEKKNQDFMDNIKDKLDILGKEVKLFQPIEIGAYGYEGMDNIYTKKGSDGRQRSSIFVNTGIYFSTEMVYAYKYSFCFTEEKETSEMLKAKFADIEKAELTDEKFTNKNGIVVPYTMFRIKTTNGKEFSFPMRNDAESDKLAENINYQAKKMKTAQQ